MLTGIQKKKKGQLGSHVGIDDGVGRTEDARDGRDDGREEVGDEVEEADDRVACERSKR